MRYDPGQGIALLAYHLARIARSATDLGFVFDVDTARAALADIEQPATAKVRMLLAHGGALMIEAGSMPAPLVEPIKVGIAALPVDARDWRLRHKTTDRAFYDDARAAAIRKDGVAELLFVDPAGWLAEGSFTTLFVRRSGRLLTPPLHRGVLPGVLRAHLLERGRAVEADLSPADFVGAAHAGAAFVGNALRGLMRVRSMAVADDDGARDLKNPV